MENEFLLNLHFANTELPCLTFAFPHHIFKNFRVSFLQMLSVVGPADELFCAVLAVEGDPLINLHVQLQLKNVGK